MIAVLALAALAGWPAWNSVFDGYGTVRGVDDAGIGRSVQLFPAVSCEPQQTHAALAVTKESFGNVDVHVRLRTLRQLRRGTANAWEVGWVLWHYRDNRHFYYVALKPNGWEIGKEDPAYPGAQRFLASGTLQTFPVDGRAHDVRVVARGEAMRVYADGALLADVTDSERPYLRGALGFYSEDALVRFGVPQLR